MQKFVTNAVAFVLTVVVTILYIQWIGISIDAMTFYVKYNELVKGSIVVFLMISSITVLCALMLLKIQKITQ